MKKPAKVLIVVTLYNLGDYIDEAIQSVFNQTYQNWELIIINDGSTEEKSKERAEFYRKNGDKRVHVFSRKNEGVVKARNFGSKQASYDYICFLDADDRLRNDFLQKTVAELNKDTAKKIGFVTSFYKHFGNSDQLIELPDPDLNFLLIQNTIHTSSLIRKEAFEKVNGYDSDFFGYMDWNLWISIAEAGYTWKVIKEPLFEYRVRSGSMVSQSIKKYFELFSLLISKHKDTYVKNIENVIISAQKNYSILYHSFLVKSGEVKTLTELHAKLEDENIKLKNKLNQLKNIWFIKLLIKINRFKNKLIR